MPSRLDLRGGAADYRRILPNVRYASGSTNSRPRVDGSIIHLPTTGLPRRRGQAFFVFWRP